MAGRETLRAYVNAWDCDENDHLNIRYYYRFFEDAAAQFFALAGCTEAPPPSLRHVRYHRELRRDDSVVAVTHPVAGDDRRLVHVLREVSSGEVAATALDTYAVEVARGMPPAEAPAEAAPRSVADGPSPDLADGAPAFEGFATWRGVLRDEGRGESATDAAIIGVASDAAAHLWTEVGLDAAWLRQHGAGRVAVEMKLARGPEIVAERPVHMETCVTGVARSTFSYTHLLFDTRSGRRLAAIDGTVLALDLSARRALRWPDETRAALESRISPLRG